MQEFHRYLPLLLELEGGHVKHPDDPGGETKYGISKRAYPNLNIATLTKDDAARIYQRDYYEPIAKQVTDPAMRIMVFDTAVHSGVTRALNLYAEHATLARYAAARIEFLANLDTFTTFGRGWIRRVAKVLTFAGNLQQDATTIDTIVDHRPYSQRFLHAVQGKSGPATIRVRPLTASPGLKLDISM